MQNALEIFEQIVDSIGGDITEENLWELNKLRQFIQEGKIFFLCDNYTQEVIGKIDTSIVPILAEHHLMDDVLHQMIITLNKKCSK